MQYEIVTSWRCKRFDDYLDAKMRYDLLLSKKELYEIDGNDKRRIESHEATDITSSHLDMVNRYTKSIMVQPK